MSSVMSSIPPWLQRSLTSDSHISFVLKTLQTREDKRAAARSQTSSNANQSQSATKRLLDRFWPLNSLDSNAKKAYSVSIGTRPENAPRNRYLDVEPYDSTRLIVSDGRAQIEDASCSCPNYYLNASWVRERAGGQWWIASQAALPSTAHDFLSVMLQPKAELPDGSATSRIRTVVQLTQTFEHGRRKADVYFPEQVGRSIMIDSQSASEDYAPPLKVTLQQQHRTDEGFVKSIVAITPLPSSPNSEPVTFTHLLYPSWPDHGVPEDVDRSRLLSFIHLVEQINRQPSLHNQSECHPPIMIGCSAGIGRTGAYIALSSILRSLGLLEPSSTLPPPALSNSPLGPLPSALNDDLVALEIDALREQRPGMVQRDEQAVFVYEMLFAALQTGMVD